MSAQPRTRIIEIANKSDLATAARPGVLNLSAQTGEGLDALISRLTDEAMATAGMTESVAITRARHRRELERTATALDHFLAGDFASLELRAEDLRHAAAALGRITGRIDVEDVLDRIFADFCIGK